VRVGKIPSTMFFSFLPNKGPRALASAVNY
jgi:hypothetical protein